MRKGKTLTAADFMSRLRVPANGGLESAAFEAAPLFGTNDRLEAARTALLQLADGANVDERDVKIIVDLAAEAFGKLESDGENAELTDQHRIGLEAVIETDGSRPVLFVQNGTINADAPELQTPMAQRWRGAIGSFLPGIRQVVGSVGAVQLAAAPEGQVPRRIGTAWAIAPGMIVTNRHVLEAFAFHGNGGRWNFTRNMEVDFAGEFGISRRSVFPITGVVMTGANPINGQVNFANLDLAVLQIGGNLDDFPPALSLSAAATQMFPDPVPPSVYVVGFPARPLIAPDADGAPPPPGNEFQSILDKLFSDKFGSKRWAPGLVKAGPGQLPGDPQSWVFAHDASTLGGNSGSVVVDFSSNGGSRVIGLHFGGRPRVENYAHALARVQAELNEHVDRIRWI